MPNKRLPVRRFYRGKHKTFYRAYKLMKSRTTRDPSPSDPTAIQESIAQRAYELYLRRGQEAGHELDDWLQAEQEVHQRQVQKPRAASVAR